MEFVEKGKPIKRNALTVVQAELRENKQYISQAREKGRGHVFINELPYPNRFIKSRAAHDFLAVRMGAIYI